MRSKVKKILLASVFFTLSAMAATIYWNSSYAYDSTPAVNIQHLVYNEKVGNLMKVGDKVIVTFTNGALVEYTKGCHICTDVLRKPKVLIEPNPAGASSGGGGYGGPGGNTGGGNYVGGGGGSFGGGSGSACSHDEVPGGPDGTMVTVVFCDHN